MPKMSDFLEPFYDEHKTVPLEQFERCDYEREGWKRMAVAMAECLAYLDTPYKGADIQTILDDIWLGLTEEENG